jgi:hypothetical protein
MDIDLGGLDRVVLVMDRRCRAGEVVNPVHLHIERECNVMAKKFKKRILQKMLNIFLRPCVEVIDADYLLPFSEKALTEMGTQKPSSPCH